MGLSDAIACLGAAAAWVCGADGGTEESDPLAVDLGRLGLGEGGKSDARTPLFVAPGG